MKTELETLPSYFRELIENSRESLVLSKKLQAEVSSLRTTIGRQYDEISALRKKVDNIEVPNQDKQPEDELVSKKEAAQILGVHVCTLERWENSRQLMPKRIGGKIYYKKSELVK